MNNYLKNCSNNCERALVLMVTNDHITPEEAKLYGDFNLKGRIADVRGAIAAYRGENRVDVKTDMRKQQGSKRRYARYSLTASEKRRVRALFPGLFREAA